MRSSLRLPPPCPPLNHGIEKASPVNFHMAEPLPSKPTKPETSNHHHHQYRRQRHQNYNRGSAVLSGDAKLTLQPERQVVFRMLCHVGTAGGVIGNSGSLVKQLENKTGCKIQFEEPVRNCHERVVNVIGEADINRRTLLKFEEFGSVEEDYAVEISSAQEGLMRVFERILEVERSGNGVIGCRLLAGNGQIGGVMGRGGSIVDGIRKNSGAKIRVLKEGIPACATPEEELIQVSL